MVLKVPEQLVHKGGGDEAPLLHSASVLRLHLCDHFLMIAVMAAPGVQEQACTPFLLQPLLLDSVQVLIQHVLLVCKVLHKHLVHHVQSRWLQSLSQGAQGGSALLMLSIKAVILD